MPPKKGSKRGAEAAEEKPAKAAKPKAGGGEVVIEACKS
jgi:hypothetical protein